MASQVFLCESCGGPVDAPWSELVIVCPFCGSQNFPGRPGGPVPPRVPVDHRARLNVGGRTYVIEGRIAGGDSAVVYRGRWVVRLGELVVIKVLRSLCDADLMRREWQTLRTLSHSQILGADHYVTRLPVPIASGSITTDRDRLAAVYGWKSGFVHTLQAAGVVSPQGIDGKVGVWILKRLLELLGFVHRAGFVHGAVTPDHVLVHPYDHGAILVGWTVATPWRAGHTQALPAVSRRWRTLYPENGSVQATPALDIAMACRCLQAAARKDLAVPIARLLERGSAGQVEDAWLLRDDLVSASLQAYGPPAYNPLPMPGWKR